MSRNSLPDTSPDTSPDESEGPSDVYLITGASGCIGAWVIKHLVEQGAHVLAADLDPDPIRPRLLLDLETLRRATFLRLDVTDAEQVRTAVDLYGATHIIHLAGLQIPGVRANPGLGARVNVEGTVNVFEAARHSGGQVRGIAYATSVAALGPTELYPERPVPDDAMTFPASLYGVYKQADEGIARIYWQDWGVGSVGLRPFIVYGVGRDQGLTSDITKAILAAAAGQPFHIKFGGPVTLQYASDVAQMFIRSAQAEHRGAAICNLRNDVVEVADFVARLREAAPGSRITHADNRLPFPADLSDANLRSILGDVPHTPLPAAIEETLALFSTLLGEGRINARQLAA
jgi:nucleoside-diphosphate-sugar epimerase